MNEQLDQDVVNLAKAIRQVESNKNPQARGASGEFGYYQFMPSTWAETTRKYKGAPIPIEQATPELQNEIAYRQIKEWKDQGKNPGQIASMWNAGPNKPNAYLEGWRGVNDYGVEYDTPKYAENVAREYHKLKGGTPTAYAAPGMLTGTGPAGYAPPQPPPAVSITPENPVSEAPKGNWLQQIGSALIQNPKNFGESIAGAMLPFTATGRQFEKDQASANAANKQFIDIVIARRNQKKAAGLDTSKEDEQLRNASQSTGISTAEFNPASQKNAKQVFGEGLGVGADILSAGVFGKAAAGLKTGVMGKAIAPSVLAPITRSQGIIRGGVQGLLGGGAAGAVQGTARAMQEDKNLAGIATDTAVGGVLGGAIGGVLGAGAGAVQAGRGLVSPDRTYNKRVEILGQVSERNARLRKLTERAKSKGIDVKDILARTNLLEGAVDNTGNINTQNAIDELTEFLSKGIDGKPGPETVIMQNLEREGKRIALADLKKRLTKAVYDSGLEGGALRRALANVDEDIAGYALKADPDGSIPLTLVQNAKVDKTRNINYLIPESKAADKAIAKGLREVVEEETTSIPVKKLNRELQQHYAVLDYLDALNGKKVQGGKLGKYFAQTTGAIVGSHFGPLGSIVGAEVGSDILGRQMAGSFGKGGTGLVSTPAMKAALELAKQPPVRRLTVREEATAFTDELPVIDAGRGKFRTTLPGKEKLPTAQGAPNVYGPEVKKKTPGLVKPAASNLYGSAAGITPQTDEEGNVIGVGYNPALGIAGLAGGKILSDQLSKQGGKAAFEGFQDLSTKLLEKLKGRTTVSKQFISDLTNSPDLKQAEKDVIRRALDDEADQIDVPTFAEKVKSELLPLERKSAAAVLPGSSRDGSFRYENITLPDELRGAVADYSEHIYASPIKTSAGNAHYMANKNAENYFAHSRIEDLPDNASRRVIEIQSDLHQKGRLEQEIESTRLKVLDKLRDGHFEKMQKTLGVTIKDIDEYVRKCL